MSRNIENSIRIGRWRSLALASICIFAVAGCSQESKIQSHTEKGDAYFASGDYEKARIEYINVTRLNPTNSHAFARIGHICYENGLALRAAAYFTRAMELGEPDPRVRARRAVLLALNDRTQAAAEAKAVIEQDPAQEEAILLLADLAGGEDGVGQLKSRLEQLRDANGDQPIYGTAEAVLELKSRNPDAARTILTDVLAANPDYAPAYSVLSSIYLSQTNKVEGEAALKRAAELSPPRSNRQMRYIDYLLQQDKAAGLARMEEIIKQAPDYVPVRLRKAQVALADKDYQTVEREVNAVVSRDRENIESRQLQAQMYLAMGQTDKAGDIMADLVKMYPAAAQLWYQAALTSVAGNHVERGLTEIEKAYELDPTLAQVVLLRGRLLMVKGRFDEAIESLRRFLAQSPDYAPGYLQLADVFVRNGEPDQALAVYQDYEVRFPRDPRGPYLQGVTQLRQGSSGDARAAFGRALDISVTYFPAIEQLAQLDVGEESFAAARERVAAYLTAVPDSAPGHLLLGRVELAAKQYAAAETQFEAAIDLEPTLQNAYYALVQIYDETGRQGEARAKLEQLLERKPDDVKSLMTLGIMASREGRNREAAERYEALIKAQPDFIPALNNLAYLYSEDLDDLDRAYVLGRKAQQLAPDDPKVGDTLGWILHLRREYTQAQVHLQESAAKLPDTGEVLYHLGMNHYRLGNAARASELLARAVELGDGEQAWVADARNGLDVLRQSASAGSESLDQLIALVEQRPNDVILLTRLARAQEQAGQSDEALGNYRRAVRLNPEAVDCLLGEARIIVSRGEHVEAMKLARAARAKSDDPRVAFEAGRVAMVAQDYPYAFALLQDAANKLGNDSEVLVALAGSAIANGRLATARDAASKAGQVDGLQRARAQELLALIDRATAEEVDRTLPPAARNVGGPLVVFIELRGQAAVDSRSAIEGYRRLLTGYPQFVPAMKQLAIELSKDPATVAEAEQWARKARETMNDDADLALVLGAAAVAREDFRYAADMLGTAARTLTDDPSLFLLLARSQTELRQVAQARASLDKARALPLTAEQKQQADAIASSLAQP